MESVHIIKPVTAQHWRAGISALSPCMYLPHPGPLAEQGTNNNNSNSNPFSLSVKTNGVTILTTNTFRSHLQFVLITRWFCKRKYLFSCGRFVFHPVICEIIWNLAVREIFYIFVTHSDRVTHKNAKKSRKVLSSQHWSSLPGKRKSAMMGKLFHKLKAITQG